MINISHPKWAISLLVVLAAIVAGCRKWTAIAGSSQVLTSSWNPENAARPGILIVSPQEDDSAVDVNSWISVKCNPLLNGREIRFQSFIVSSPAEVVEGKYIYTDTSGTFIPVVNMKTETRYTVQITGFVTKRIDSETPASIEAFDEMFSFTTAPFPTYVMERRSQEVTAFARDGSRMIQHGDHLYLYGGWRGNDMESNSFNDIYRSTGDLSQWQRMPDAPWQGRHTFGLGKLHNEIYVFGGDQHTEYFDVWKSKDGVQFTQVAQDLDSKIQSRLIYGACTHKGKLYILGGQSSLDLDAGLTDVWTSPNGFGWRRLASNEIFLGKNLAGSVVSFNDKLYIIGGGYYGHPDSSQRWTNHIYSSPDGKTWTREADAPWEGRQFADVCVWDNKIWMVGGHNGSNLSEIWFMNTDGTWVQYQPSNLFTARHATAVAVFNDQLVLACGDLNNECWVIRKP